MYRKQASRELLRPSDTRFATYYISLKRVVDEKTSIRGVVCNNEWENSQLSKESKGKELEKIILGIDFWQSAIKVLKICENLLLTCFAWSIVTPLPWDLFMRAWIVARKL